MTYVQSEQLIMTKVVIVYLDNRVKGSTTLLLFQIVKFREDVLSLIALREQ